MAMKRLGYLVFAGVLVTLVPLATPAAAVETVKHSGSIVSVADDAKTFVLAEVGPWRLRNGVTVVTHRTITLAPDTQFALVERAVEAPSGFAGDFVERRLGPEHVYLNDYVTVACRHEGQRLVALSRRSSA
jgi:hypothetical protein